MTDLEKACYGWQQEALAACSAKDTLANEVTRLKAQSGDAEMQLVAVESRMVTLFSLSLVVTQLIVRVRHSSYSYDC